MKSGEGHWYRHDYYQTLASLGPLARNPQGPAESFDPSEPGVKKKVHKGGSFLCTDQYCARYIAGGRGKGEPCGIPPGARRALIDRLH